MAERKRIKKAPAATPSKVNTKTVNKKPESSLSKNTKREIWGVVITAVGLILALGFYFDAAGIMGAGLKGFFLGLFGNVSYSLPVLVTVLGIYTILKKDARLSYSLSAILFW